MAHADVVAGRFELESPVGSGGMGTVYRALDRQTGRHVALKMLRAWTDSGAALAARLGREGRALAALQHPSIVGYVAHGVTANGDPYLAMEFIRGQSLARIMGQAPARINEKLTETVLRGVARSYWA